MTKKETRASIWVLFGMILTRDRRLLVVVPVLATFCYLVNRPATLLAAFYYLVNHFRP